MSDRKALRVEHLPGKLLTMKDVVAQTGVTRQAIYNRIARGTFPAPHVVGRFVVWPATDIEAWRAAQRVAAR